MAPFLQAITLVALCFVGPGIAMWPCVVPVEVTIGDAAAPEKSQVFMLAGAVVPIPLILAHTACACRIFRGEIDPGAGCR